MPRFYGRHGETCPIGNALALKVRDLWVRYPGAEQDVLRGLDLAVSGRTCTALVGHNGAGKSTLLKAVAGLLPFSRGGIEIYGHAVGGCRHRVAYLSQRSSVEWTFPATVEELALTGRYVHLGWGRRPARSDFELVRSILQELGIYELRHRQIGTLSGGQQQRMLLARALAQEAQLLLLDEPLNALDQSSREFLIGQFLRMKAAGKTLLISTHDHDDLGSPFDQVLLLFEGKIITRGGAGKP